MLLHLLTLIFVIQRADDAAPTCALMHTPRLLIRSAARAACQRYALLDAIDDAPCFLRIAACHAMLPYRFDIFAGLRGAAATIRAALMLAPAVPHSVIAAVMRYTMIDAPRRLLSVIDIASARYIIITPRAGSTWLIE